MTYLTFIINLAARKDRMKVMHDLMTQYSLVYNRFEAYEGVTPQAGIKASIQAICLHCLNNNVENVLIFEDDVRFERDDWRDVFDKAITELPIDYDLLTLGANIEKPEWAQKFSPSLYKLTTFKALHAVLYSRAGMQHVLGIKNLPIDEYLIGGNYYITYPLLATQRPGFSDIRNKNVNYDFMRERYGLAVNYANEKINI